MIPYILLIWENIIVTTKKVGDCHGWRLSQTVVWLSLYMYVS
jgi:hypothetical protein